MNNVEPNPDKEKKRKKSRINLVANTNKGIGEICAFEKKNLGDSNDSLAGFGAELYEFAPCGYFTLAANGDIIESNRRGSGMLGHECADDSNNNFYAFVSDDTKPVFNRFLSKLFKSKATAKCEVQLMIKGHLPMVVQLEGISSRNSEECLIMAVDIAEHTRREKEIRESERFLKDTQMIAQLGTYSVDVPSGRWVSSEVLDLIFGIDEHFERTVEGWTSIIHPDWQKTMSDYFTQEVLRSKTSFDRVYKIIRQSDHAHRWVHGKGRLDFNEKNQVVTMVGTIRDITESKLAEEALKRSELLLKSSLESQKDTILLSIDRNYRYLYFNKAHWETMKCVYNSDVRIGMNILDCITSDDDREEARDNYSRALLGESHCNIRQYGDIEQGWYESFFNPIIDDNKEIIGATVLSRNITARKKTEMAIQEGQARLRKTQEMAHLGSWELNIKTNKLIWSDEVYRIFGLHPKEVEITHEQFIEMVHPDDRAALALAYFGSIEQNQDSYEIEHRIIRRQTGEIRFVFEKCEHLRDASGVIFSSIGMVLDITINKQAEAEMKLKNEELQRINAEKDKFFSIIAHDLRSPFNGFLGLTEMMAEGLPNMTLDDIQKIAILMRSSATNLFRLLGNLLEWSIMQRGLATFVPDTFLLQTKIFESVALILEAAKEKEITITYDLPEDVSVFADSNMLDGIIRNLVFNAVKFTNKGGLITISARSIPGNLVEISITDTGIGMSQHMIDDLFRLDINTNRKGTKGEYSTGLGLILCKDFIEKHGGKLEIHSEENRGSQFRVTLPARFNNEHIA